MASTPTRNDEKKSSWLSQTASSLSGGQKVSVSRSEEFLTRISNELTEEALFIAGYHVNSVPTKEKQTKDQGTQISNHVLFTKTGGTDTCSDRNHTHTKAHHLSSLREKPPMIPGDFFLLTFKEEPGSLQIFELPFELLALWLIKNVRRGNGTCLKAPLSKLVKYFIWGGLLLTSNVTLEAKEMFWMHRTDLHLQPTRIPSGRKGFNKDMGFLLFLQFRQCSGVASLRWRLLDINMQLGWFSFRHFCVSQLVGLMSWMHTDPYSWNLTV